MNVSVPAPAFHTVFATLAILAIFVLGLKAGQDLSRLLLGLFLLGLLVATPFARYVVKLGLSKVGLWDSENISSRYFGD